MDYIKKPMVIEEVSFKIIDGKLLKEWKEEELPLVRRIIHTSGDFDYERIIKIHPEFISRAKEALKDGGKIYCDTKMIMAGVNKATLNRAGFQLVNYLDDEEIVRKSKEENVTRSILSLKKAAKENIRIYVFGNAPTALFALLEEIDRGLEVDLIIGVPVGFVGASESKEYLTNYNVPYITTRGTKGGSNIAVSILNALLYMIHGRY